MIKDVDVIESNCNEHQTCESLDSVVEQVVDKITKAMANSIPKKQPYEFRYFYSHEIHLLTKERNHSRNMFIHSGDSDFRKEMNNFNRLIKEATARLNQKSFNEKIGALETKDRSLYQFAKYLKTNKTITPPLVKNNLELAYTNQEKADALATAFLRCHLTSHNLISIHETAVNKSLKKVTESTPPASSLVRISKAEVVKVIKYLKTRKAPGLDKIPNLIIKALPSRMITLLTSIFNDCLRLSYFPSHWKIAKIIAIPKAGKDNSIPTNFRPISLLSNVGKIFEKLLLDRLQDFEFDNKIIAPHQFGFRNAHSTIHQVIRITEKISKNFNLRRSTGMVLLDIEKAFDSVWHNALVHKLLTLKFPLYLVKLVLSYLTDRKALVDVMGSPSAFFKIPAGVPQGSLLAPLLFNLFINDIVTPRDCELAIYADDTALTCESKWKNVRKIKATLENALAEVTKFFLSWKIKINSSKTEFIMFSKSTVMLRKLQSNQPVVENQELCWLPSVTYLGTSLDSKLTFRQHIELAISKAKKAMATLFCLLKRNSALDTDAKLLMYTAYIRPILTYAGIIFHNCAKTHFQKLQILQNKCLRMALNAHYYTKVSTLHEQTKVPTIMDFINKNSEKFYDKVKFHDNALIQPLGDYSTLWFRFMHKMPRPS